MAQCKDCIHWDKCSKKDGKTRYYGKQCAANNVEILCEWFVNTAEVVPKSEVAKEIFAELDKIMKPQERYLYCNPSLTYVYEMIEELKKKYTESEDTK